MAKLLGQDVGALKEKGDEIREEMIVSKQNRVKLAIGSMLVGALLFYEQRANPGTSLNLMQFLSESSDPVEIIGNNDKPTMIEFSAQWCENCKAMAKRVLEVENEYRERVNFVVVDGDDERRADIVEQFGVDGVPQFSMVSKDGTVKGNLIGMIPKEALKEDLQALLEEKDLPFPGVPLEELRGL